MTEAEFKRDMRRMQTYKDLARYFRIKAILAETEEESIEFLKKEDYFNLAYIWLLP